MLPQREEMRYNCGIATGTARRGKTGIEEEQAMGEREGTNLWFERVVLVLLACLLGLGCLLVWRMAETVKRIEEGVVSVSTDVKTVTRLAARISEKVDGLMDRVDVLEAKLKGAVPLDELENVLDELEGLRGKPAELDAEARAKRDREVGHLLGYVRGSGCVYLWQDREVGALAFYANLLAKYKLYEESVGSAEEFIDKVATKSMVGKPYYVVMGPKRVEVAAYLREELAKYRAAQR